MKSDTLSPIINLLLFKKNGIADENAIRMFWRGKER